ncbi:EF-hand domain-containing protein [Sphingomonas sp.]|uniref:EF-hand domain-containing protein n=1 Tax=Sphingomonas sp. TaxID=28214 RepID=UPI00286D1E72|nr:EF-hand domain-containing protein [Sphingomonas sp.]
MNKYLLGGAIAASLVAIAPAIAQTPAPAPVAPMVHNQAWHGRPSVQTRAEVAAHVRTMFDRLDSNRDGSVTKAEAAAAKGQFAERHRHGGGVGGQMADRGAMFDRLDANHDGSISRAEFDAAHAQHQQYMASRDQNGDGRPNGSSMGGGRRMGGGHGMGGMGGRMFALADSNRDGRVTLQEATNAALRHFDTADVNRDGQLSPEERMQMHQRMRAEHKPS